MSKSLTRLEIEQQFRSFDQSRVNLYKKKHKINQNQDVDHKPHFIDSLNSFLTLNGTSIVDLTGRSTHNSLLNYKESFQKYIKEKSKLRMRHYHTNRSDNHKIKIILVK